MCIYGAPKHPGKVLHSEHLKPQGISLQEAANRVGVTRQSISNLVNGHCRLSVNMAVSLSRIFGRTAREWLNLQTEWDLWQVCECH